MGTRLNQDGRDVSLLGDGEMVALINAHDWSKTPLGALGEWPQALTAAVQICLNTPIVSAVFWGPDLRTLYNDAYAPSLAERHPWALGLPFGDVWPEIQDVLGPQVATVMATGRGFSSDHQLLTMNRNGVLEDTYWIYSFAPLYDGSETAGVLLSAFETTGKVMAEQRLSAAREHQRQMLLQMPGFVAMLSGPELVYTYVNDAYVTISERTDFVGRRFRDVFSDITGQGFHELFENVFHTGKGMVTRGMELRLHGRIDLQYVDFVVEPVRDDNGVVTGVFVGGYETTEIYRGNAALRAREERARALAELSDRLRDAEDAGNLPHLAAEILGRVLDVSQVGYGTINDADETLHIARDWTASGVESLAGTVHLRSYGSFIDSLRRGEFIAIADVRQDPRTASAAAALESRSARSFVNAPVVERGRLAAVLYINHATARDWDAEELTFIKDVAERTWSAMERARAEAELRTSEARYRELNAQLEQRVADGLAERKVLADLVEGTDALIIVADLNYRFLAINRAAADEFEGVYGIRPAVGEDMLALLADRPEHQAAVRNTWGRALAGEEFTETAEFGDPQHGRRFYEIKFNTLRNAHGDRTGAYQFVYDVTARVAEQRRLADAEAARRDADALYRAYFENTAEALFVVGVLADGGFTIEDLNPAHQASIGLPIEEVRGKRIDETLPADLAEQISSHYRRVVASGEVLQYRETFEVNGSPTYWDTVLVPVPGEDGRVESLIGSSRDLTRQQAAEEQLRQTQKMDAMGQLTGGVAHDFNNLLTPIIGSLDMLMVRGVGSERERRLIDGALQSAERAKTLVQRLLAFARRQPLQPSAVDLRTLVSGMADLIGSTVGPTIEIRVALQEGLPPAYADANQLEMALLNLAVNARDAMPDGGVLTIEAKRQSVRDDHRVTLKRGHYVLLTVADTGAGMDDVTLARAIEPFFSTKGIGKGTGLGLSMVHGLAAQLGGALNIESAPGRGTAIELWLPISRAPIEMDDGPTMQLDASPNRGRALLVDDEELVRMSTADMLMDLGFDVTEAASAEEALRIVEEKGPPDLLVTDHLMPGMNGADLARMLRRTKAELPVLVVSGYAEADGVAPDLARLTKPFRNAELAERIASLGL